MRRKVLLTILVVAAVAAACGVGTYAAFSSSTTTPSNSFSAGTVSISDSHTGSTALVGLTTQGPSAGNAVQSSGCVTVTYGGSLPAYVRLYATSVSGASLSPYIDVKVTRGSWSGAAPSYPSCTGFVTTGESNWIGQGTGVTYSGTLSAMPTSWTGTTNEPASATPETWTNGETHVYKFEVNVDSAAPASAQGQSASASFTWEAQNQ